ncbi:MAG: peptide deformylase [Alphaproteobacteria bacterium]|nr:peptide deformylase [Alphaproteobacteria bacterium]
MAILSIITAPDPRLKRKSEPVERVDAALRKLLDDMLETMYDAPGYGLAAIQVGVAKQAIVIDIAPKDTPRQPLYLVNPRIVAASEDLVVGQEGCLSLPDQFVDIERPRQITVRHLDYAGAEREFTAEGLLAVCVQHEMDHLTGTLLLDLVSPVKRDMLLRKLLKARRSKAAG